MTDFTFLPGEGNPVPPEQKAPENWPYGAPTPTPTPGGPGPLDPEQRNAYEFLLGIFESYDLGVLAPEILDLVQQGYGADTITLMLRQTQPYKDRFRANDARIKAGLPALSPAEYISTERAYRQIMQSAGMPPGFYDSHDDFTQFLIDDKSPAEIQERVDLAIAHSTQAPPNVTQALQEFYGVGPGGVAAFFLDREKALPLLQRIGATAQIGAAALSQGLRTTLERAQEYALRGVSGTEALEGFGRVAEAAPRGQALAQAYGEPAYGQETAEAEFLGGSQAAAAQRQRLIQREVGTFSGSSGVARGSLAKAKTY